MWWGRAAFPALFAAKRSPSIGLPSIVQGSRDQSPQQSERRRLRASRERDSPKLCARRDSEFYSELHEVGWLRVIDDASQEAETSRGCAIALSGQHHFESRLLRWVQAAIFWICQGGQGPLKRCRNRVFTQPRPTADLRRSQTERSRRISVRSSWLIFTTQHEKSKDERCPIDAGQENDSSSGRQAMGLTGKVP